MIDLVGMPAPGSSSRRRRGLVTYIWDRMVGHPMPDDAYYRLTSEPGPDGQYDRSYTAAGDLEYFRRRTQGVPISSKLMFILDGMLEHEFQDQDGRQPCQPDGDSCGNSERPRRRNPSEIAQEILAEANAYMPDDEFGDAPSNEDMLAEELDEDPQNQDNANYQNGDCQPGAGPGQNMTQNGMPPTTRQGPPRSDSPFLNTFMQNTRRPPANAPFLTDLYLTAQRISMRCQNELNQTAQEINNLMGLNVLTDNAQSQNAAAPNDVNQNGPAPAGPVQDNANPNALRHNMSAFTNLLPRSVRQNMSSTNTTTQNGPRANAPTHNDVLTAHQQNLALQQEIIRNARLRNLPLYNEVFHRDPIIPQIEPFPAPGITTFQEAQQPGQFGMVPPFMESLPNLGYLTLPPMIDARLSYHLPMFGPQNGQQSLRQFAQCIPSQNPPLYVEGHNWQYAPQFSQSQMQARFNSTQSMPSLDAYSCMPPLSLPMPPRGNAPRPQAHQHHHHHHLLTHRNSPDDLPDFLYYPMIHSLLYDEDIRPVPTDLQRYLPPGMTMADVAARAAVRRRATRARAAMRDAQLNRAAPPLHSAPCGRAATHHTTRPAFTSQPTANQVGQQDSDTAPRQNAPEVPPEQPVSNAPHQPSAPEAAPTRVQRAPRQPAQADEPAQRASSQANQGQSPPSAAVPAETLAQSPTVNQAPSLQNNPRASAFQPAPRRSPPAMASLHNPAIEELTRRIVHTIAERLRSDLRDPQRAAALRRGSVEFETELAAEETLRTYYREIVEARRRAQAGNNEAPNAPRQNAGRGRGRRAMNRQQQQQPQPQANADPDADLLSISPVPENEAPAVVAQSRDSDSEFDREADRWSVSSQQTDDDFL